MKPRLFRLYRSVLLTLIIFTGFPDEVFTQEINPKAAKYHSALQKRPSGGYLFDRFFNAWLDTGTIDSLDQYLKAQIEKEDAQTADRLLYGYFLSKQGREDEALSAFETSLKVDPENTEALSELAKARARSLDFDHAVQEVDKALALDPKKELAIELGKLKGRWLSRSGKSDEAIKAWQELIASNPDDDELREDLVDLLLDESLIEEALKTQKALVETTTDPYLKITRKLRLGDIHLRSGQRDDAKSIYTDALQASGRDTWLEKEILSQIEQLFRKEDDLAGLKKYYQEIVEKEKGRIAILRRLAMVYAEQQESDQAITVFKEILKATPGDRANREAFIALLGRLGKNDEAVEQMKALMTAHPDDTELVASLAAWQNRAENPGAARDTVLKFVEMSDQSEYTYLRAARMLEQFKQPDAATQLFEKLITAFPDSIGAKEEHAAFLYRAEKKEDAIAIWREIAANGSNDDAIRAARMLSSRGQREDAFQILKKRVDEFSNDFLFLGRLCEEALASNHADEALPWAEKRLSLVEAPTDLSEALRQILAILSRTNKTDEYREQLQSRADDLKLNQACLLSEMQERNGEFSRAEDTLKPWMDQGETLALDQRVRQLISRDDWERAASTMRRIVELPDGRRSNQIEKLVTLYRRSLQFDEAFKWLEEWKKVSPGSYTPWIQQATIEHEEDQTDKAIETLRLTVNRFSDEEAPRTLLATYYQRDGKAADAERIYWNLYEESEEIGEKIRWAASLAAVAESEGKIDRLVEQFEERRRSNRTSIAPLLAIAEIHRKSDNYEGRREALLEATRLRPEDLTLLHQIARIEEEEGEWERALDTLETAVPLDKSEGTKRRIALIHLRYGDEEEGYRKFSELRGGDSMDVDSVISLADAMISRNGWERGRQFLSQHVERFPDDFRVPYLYAITLEESNEQDLATEVFLNLLSHDKEIPTMRQTTSLATSTSQVNNTYYGELPEGYNALSQHVRNCYFAYQYRAYLRSGRNRFQNNLSGSGLVAMPKSLEVMHNYVLSHLHGISELEDTKEKVAAEIASRGIKNGDLILASTFSEQYSTNHAQLPALLEAFPDNQGVLAFAVVTQINNLRNRTPVTDSEMLIKSGQKLKPDYPHLALVALLGAASDDDSELQAQTLAEIAAYNKGDTVPPGILSNTATSLLLNFEAGLSPALVAELKSAILKWRELQRKEAEKKPKSSNLATSFPIGDTYSAVLRNSDDLTEFATYLDEQCDAYEKMLAKNGSASKNVSSLGRYQQYVSRGQAMLSPLSFPPAEMIDMAPNVLWNFITTRNINFGYTLAPLDPEAVAKVVDKVKDPFLGAILYNLAENPEAAGNKIEEILAASKNQGRKIPIKSALFAAGWYQQNEEWEKAAEILESVRLAPMPRSLRQRIDAAIIVSAREAEIGEKESQVENPTGLAKWGPDAALRLRYGFLDSSKRGELVSALDDFGFKDAAKRLEAKGVSVAATARNYTSGTQVQGVAGRINQFVKDDKKADALKLLERTLKLETKAFALSGRGNWNYELFRMIREVSSENESLFNELRTKLLPADDAPARELIEYAALLDITGKTKDAATYYEKGVAAMPPSQQSKYLSRFALVKGAIDPEGAAKILAGMHGKDRALLAADSSSIRSSLDYGKTELSKSAVFQNHATMYTLWLNSLDEETRFDRYDYSFLDQAARYHLISENSLQIYTPPARRPFQSSDKIPKELVDKHQTLCLAFTKIPVLARDGFSFYEVLAHEEEAGNTAELEKLARSSLEYYSKKSSTSIAQTTTSWNNLSSSFLTRWFPEEYLIWQAKLRAESQASLEPVMELLKLSKDRNAIKTGEDFLTLAYGQPADFAKTALDYLNSGPVQNQSYYSGYGNHQTHSSAAKVFTIWKHRKAELEAGFDMESFLLSNVKKAKQQQRNELTILSADYTAWLAENQGWQAAERFLLALTEEWLGPKKNWDKFKKEAQRKVPNGNSFYYTGGDFIDPAHKQFQGLLSRCAWHPSTVFHTLRFVKANGLDTNQQVSSSSMIQNLDNNNVTQNIDLTETLILGSPFVSSADSFSTGTVRQDQNSAFITLINGASRWKDVERRNQLREKLKSLNTFGSNLSLAYLDHLINQPDGDDDVPNVLAIYRKDIETMPGELLDELASTISIIYPKGFPRQKISPESEAVFELLGAQKAKSIAEEADQFLEVKSLADIDVRYGSALVRKIGPFLDPLLQSGKWDDMEKIYYHAVALGEQSQAKEGFGSYDSAWNLRGDLLYDLLDDTSGGGIERIAFFERVTRKDRTKGTIALTGGGMRMATHLFQAVDQRMKEVGLEKALHDVYLDLWNLSGNEATPQLAISCREFIGRLKPPQIVKAIAWADKTAAGDSELARFANELSNAWRLNLAITDLKGFERQKKQIPDFNKWEAHYLPLLKDETSHVAWRCCYAGVICRVPTGDVDPETVYACADVMAQALAEDAPFNGWQFVHVAKSFNLLPRDDRWIETANRMHEGWVLKNKNNHFDSETGKAWNPWSNPVLLSLQMHTKLGDPEKLKAFLNEKNAENRLSGSARTLFALVEAGFIDEALEALKNAPEKADHGTGYPTGKNDYAAYYSPEVHKHLPEFLEKIEEPGLRYLANLLIVGAPDPPMKDRQKNLPYKDRFGRYVEVTKQYPETDFGDNEVIRKAALRQIAYVEHCGFILKDHIKNEFENTDLTGLCSSQNYTTIGRETRVVSAHISNEIKQGRLKALRDFIEAIGKKDQSRYYYRREALKHVSGHLAKSIKNRSHHMKPAEIRDHLDAFHLLLRDPKEDILKHTELRNLIISYIAGRILIANEPDMESKLDQTTFSKGRETLLAKTLGGNRNAFFVQFKNAYNFEIPVAKFKVEDDERHRRVEATLQHPMVIRALKNEKDLWGMMQKFKWVNPEETDSEWGKSLLKKWDELQASAE
ncbi:MAG: tetratricopeptide repeat protein [Verrucomicrobiales bacterium]|nr:tetratricopeptide repeat protein [Verrucomicrobiales bacterium]